MSSLKEQLLRRLNSIEAEIQEIRLLLSTEISKSDSSGKSDDAKESSSSAEDLVKAIFQLAMSELDEEELLTEIAPMLHSSIADHHIAISNFLRYSFKTFQGRWSEYLNNVTDPASYEVERRQENTKSELKELRLYLKVGHRSSAPISLKEDPKRNRCWKIASLSL